MVCLGNICRSPLAHGIMLARIAELGLDWEVDSAGTGAWHVGEQPDRRSAQVALENGIDISSQRARQFVKGDFMDFDHIIAMDASNYNNIIQLANSDAEREKVTMLLNYSYPGQNRQVPDPYYEGGFDSVYKMIYQAVDDFINIIIE